MEYEIIYADPAWQYDFCKDNADKIENHYPTMTQQEICNLAVPSAKNSVLYLWATAPKLIEALEVMKAWGFTYKTNMVWDKELIGMGYWWRGRHELLLVGTKGKFSPPESAYRFPSVLNERRTKHSKKPDIVRERIASAFPTKSKIELFAREPHEGWHVWGNEVESDICLK